MHPIALVTVALVLLYFLIPVHPIKVTVDILLDQAISDLIRDAPAKDFSNVYNTSTAVSNLCSSLVGRTLLFIGPETTYYLHSLWLDALQAHDNREISCIGPGSCFHHVCHSASHRHHNGRSTHFPQKEELLATNSSLLRYVRSHSLHASDDPKDSAYTQPTVDGFTGVRLHNTYWLRHAQQADVVVLNHGPLPAPVSTYDDEKWTFPDQPVYVKGAPVVNAGLHATLTVFLPAVVGALDTLGGLKKRPVVVWHSSWLMDGGCSDRKQRGVMEDPLNEHKSLASDPWTLYYNVQGKFNHHI
ncbi:hypothetical protein C0991_007233 [Blastosporella zonata]|nr:hypothetical protein C0991_007233 [Blastosporella zonata]